MQATNIYTDVAHPRTYIVRLTDGAYRHVTPAFTAVTGAIHPSVMAARLRSRAWDGRPTAQEITGHEADLLLGTLNAALAAQEEVAP